MTAIGRSFSIDLKLLTGLARVNGREDSSVKKNRDEGSVHGSRVLSTVVGYGDEGDERLWFQPGIC
ncbi:hypothetical protein H0E87_010592 [Populus deltoides]|uniref:Uncharacterized protein n=1 Tax=Populus deltoides TaxID=3696 RepID=A0A8T2YTN5_POPDE|nr:hypothetical protein H0E87_010592 [Populus deltoides]